MGSGSPATSCATVTGPATSRCPPTHSASASSSATIGSRVERSSVSAAGRRSVAAQLPPTRATRPSASSCSNQPCQAGTGRHHTSDRSRSCSSSARGASGAPDRALRRRRPRRGARAPTPGPAGRRAVPRAERPRPRGTATARVRRSSSGAPSRKVNGLPVRIPWASGEGSDDSTKCTPIRPPRDLRAATPGLPRRVPR